MQQTRKLELWVGTFVIAGICAILIMIFQVADVKGIGSNHTYNLKATFDNIGSLKVRSPVKVGASLLVELKVLSLIPIAIFLSLNYLLMGSTHNFQIPLALKF